MVKGSAAKPGSRIGMVKSNYAGAICSLFDLIQGSPWVWLILSRLLPTISLMGNAHMRMEISPETKICKLIRRPSSNEGLDSTGTNREQVVHSLC